VKNDILPILLGATEGAYALSRAFYHDYGIRPLVLDEHAIPLLAQTACACLLVRNNLSRPHILFRVLEDLYEKGKGKSLLLIPMTEAYTARLREREAWLSSMFLLPHMPTALEREEGGSPFALLFLHRSEDGAVRTVYGEIAAWANKAPAVLFARPAPHELADAARGIAQDLERGCYLFSLCENENGETELLSMGADFSPLSAMTFARDVSIPELFITEQVLCEPLPEADGELFGIFSLFSYRKTKGLIPRAYKKEYRQKRRRFTSLYSFGTEPFSFAMHRIFCSFYPQKKPKK